MKSLTSAQMGKIGGPARAKALTPQERKEIARLGGKARAAKFKERQNGAASPESALPEPGTAKRPRVTKSKGKISA